MENRLATRKAKEVQILLVDDHEFLLMGLAGVFNHAPGLTVVGQASSLDEGKRLILKLKPDVVILDLAFPDGSGVDMARYILGACPTIRILFLTSFGDEHTVLEAVLTGVHGFLLKDVTPKEFVRAVRAVASGQIFIDPRVMKQSLQWLRGITAQSGKRRRSLLSPQEQNVLPLVAQGLTNKEIANALRLSELTVKTYINNICTKLRIGRRSMLASFYARSFKQAGRPTPPSDFLSHSLTDPEDF